MVDFQEIQRYNARRIYIFKNSFKLQTALSYERLQVTNGFKLQTVSSSTKSEEKTNENENSQLFYDDSGHRDHGRRDLLF